MGRTYIRPDAQVQSSTVYNGGLAAGPTLQSNAVSIEDDLNALRSQVNKILDVTGAGNWYDAVNITDAKQRSLKQLNVSVDTLETKPQLKRVITYTSITVPNNQNFVVLTVANNQTPSLPLAIGATTIGAVAAQSTFSGTSFAVNELTAIAGSNVLRPKNLCIVHDASTGQTIESGGLDVFALLQAESTAADGGTINDTSAGNRVKLSFVTLNTSTGALQAAAAADLSNRTLQYGYNQRLIALNVPEDAYLSDAVYLDQIAAVDITLTTAVLNQAGAGVTMNSNVLWRVGSGYNFKVQNAAGSQDFLAIGSNGASSLNVPSLAITSTTAPTVTSGVQVATSTQTVNVGTTTGQIDSAGLTLAATGANKLKLVAGNQVNLTDGFLGSSTYTGAGVPLAATAAEWSQFTTNFGGTASLVSALNQAKQEGNRYQVWTAVTAARITAGTNVTGSGGSANVDAVLPAYTNFTGQVLVYVNGQLMRPGANAAAGFDVYPGTSSSTGDLMFAFDLIKSTNHTDVITMIVTETAANS